MAVGNAMVISKFPDYDELRYLKFPMMQKFQKRLDTFRLGWKEVPISAPVFSIADAGFFAVNRGRAIKCFACGVGAELTVTDDPYFTHAMISPHCTFLERKKGRTFIESILRGNPIFYNPPGGARLNRTTIRLSSDINDGNGTEDTKQGRETSTKHIVLQWALKYSPIVEKLTKYGFHHEDIEKAVRMQFSKSGGMFTSVTQAIHAVTKMVYESRNKANEKFSQITELQNMALKKLVKQKMCFSCGERIAIILIFPCQHISLCKTCKPHHTICPKCNGVAAEFWIST